MIASARAVVVSLMALAVAGCGEPGPEPPAYVARVKVRLFYGAAESDHVARSLPFLAHATLPRGVLLQQASVTEAYLTPDTRIALRLDDGEVLQVGFCRQPDGFHFEVTSLARTESPIIVGTGDARGFWFVGNATRLTRDRHPAHIVVQASERIGFGCSPALGSP